MKNIRYLTASERINYGDLLFPIIFKFYFERDFNFHNYGLIKSDNSYFGALKTDSFRSLRKRYKKDDVIVIGGGEVFFSRWSILLSFIYPSYNFLYNQRVFKKIESITNLTSYLFGGQGSYSPYVPEFSQRTIYIGCGGQFNEHMSLSQKNKLKSCLNKSKFLSVRDKRTFDSLSNENIAVKLMPDSAIVMSKIFKKQELKLLKTLDDKIQDHDYIFLQLALTKGPNNIESFVSDLSKVAEQRKLKVICCPIGLVPGHDDHIILQKMVQLSENWIYVEPHNIYDIMFLIAFSKLYVGTSLHGAITAFAYGLPIVPLNKKIKKLSSFVQTWTCDIYIDSIDFHDIQWGVEEAFKKWNPNKASLLLSDQQKEVEVNFEEIKNIINGKV